MSATTDEVNEERRQFLTATTAVLGGIGVACASVPFINSWMPSERTKSLGAPVEVDISKILPGQKITVPWRGQPIFVVHRTDEALTHLEALEGKLRDPLSHKSIQPDYTVNQHRSIKKNFLVAVGLCTHLGCVPVYKPKAGSLDAKWLGGFFCPCHGSKYDFAGRVYKGVPAPTNLVIPPHYYPDETTLLIGEESPEQEGDA